MLVGFIVGRITGALVGEEGAAVGSNVGLEGFTVGNNEGVNDGGVEGSGTEHNSWQKLFEQIALGLQQLEVAHPYPLAVSKQPFLLVV